MAIYFLDSSALAKRYLEEPGTQRVTELMGRAQRLVVSHLTAVEVASAASRRARAGHMPAELAENVFRTLEEDLREFFDVIQLGGATIARAVDLTRSHALRAADAIQLASALLARGETGSVTQFALVSSDRELNDAARQEGLAVIDPTADNAPTVQSI